MSIVPQARVLRERAAGKWQIPLLFVAIGSLIASLLTIKPPQGKIPFDIQLERIIASIDGQMYMLAIHDARNLVAHLESNLEDDDGSFLPNSYLLLGRSLSFRAQQTLRHSPAIVEDILHAYDQAKSGRQKLLWEDHRNLGLAFEWQEDFESAVASYEDAVALSQEGQLELVKRIIELRQGMTDASPDELHHRLDDFIPRVLEQEDLLHWAVELKVELFADQGRHEDALALLEELRPTFERLPSQGRFDYLEALIHYLAGRYDQAEGILRALRNSHRTRDDLDAKSGWLLGRVVLFDGGPKRPEDALSFFRDVISTHAEGLYVDASKLGIAEGLAAMQRYDDSLTRYNQVLSTLSKYDKPRILNRGIVRASLTMVAQELDAVQEFARALDFMVPAAELVDASNTELLSHYLERLAEWRAALARKISQEAESLAQAQENQDEIDDASRRSAELFMSAAETFVELSRLITLNEVRSARAIWQAAELFDEAGDQARTVMLLQEFVRERPDSNMIPRALLRLGQSLQAMGRFEEAVEAYQENYRRFPRTPDAGSALIPLARCFLALGLDRFDEAEKTLRLILDDSKVFTPEAPEFADALFLLGDLLSRQERFEDSIPLLTEAMERYPEDHRWLRAEFLLADAYRQSGLALRSELPDARFAGERDRLKAEYTDRLNEAARIFGGLIQRFERTDELNLSDIEAMYLRYARLYEGDCWFELRDYERAMKKYERAAWIYRDLPSSLAAYVQVINCHAFLGEPDEAQAALRRAKYLLRTIPDEAFADSAMNGSRQEWEQYFRWVDQSQLF